jgi:hypothetical protein
VFQENLLNYRAVHHHRRFKASFHRGA